MTRIFNISLGLKNGERMTLTTEGFKNSRYDNVTFMDAEKAKAYFDDIDASALVRDGFKGYHVVEVWLTAYTVDDDEEVQAEIVSKKTITVDTLDMAA